MLTDMAFLPLTFFSKDLAVEKKTTTARMLQGQGQ